MSCSETDMGPSGGPCAICGEYPYCHSIENDHHKWRGLIWRGYMKLFHSDELETQRASWEYWRDRQVNSQRLYWKLLPSGSRYLSRTR